MARTAREILTNAGLEGVNFMTPDWISDEKLGDDSAVELSGGRGMDGEPIFGVTVVWHGERFGHDKSNLFYSCALARTYIDRLRTEAMEW